jgi:hypothetical protein
MVTNTENPFLKVLHQKDKAESKMAEPIKRYHH